MTGFFKGKGVSQIDKLLINGKVYTEKEIKDSLGIWFGKEDKKKKGKK